MIPTVSIVLPTYRRPHLLDSAIQAVVAQTFTDWELIVVNDASGDETPNIVEAWSKRDNRIRLITNSENLHLPRSLNVGFEAAAGRLWTWTSDDNVYRPTALHALVQVLNNEPKAVLAYTSMEIVDEAGAHVRQWDAMLPENQPLQPWVGACFLYRSEIAKQIGPYQPEFYLAEDLDYWIRMRLLGPMIAIPEVHYAYRIHSGSLSNTLKERARQVSAEVVVRHLDQMTWLSPDSMAEAALGVADAAIRRGDRKTARKYAVKALKHQPSRVFRTFKRGLFAAFTRP